MATSERTRTLPCPSTRSTPTRGRRSRKALKRSTNRVKVMSLSRLRAQVSLRLSHSSPRARLQRRWNPVAENRKRRRRKSHCTSICSKLKQKKLMKGGKSAAKISHRKLFLRCIELLAQLMGQAGDLNPIVLSWRHPLSSWAKWSKSRLIL